MPRRCGRTTRASGSPLSIRRRRRCRRPASKRRALVCYFIQTHRHPGQIHRLVRTIRRGSPDSLIVIGHDESVSHLDSSSLADVPRVVIRPSHAPVRRGTLSNLQPYFNAVDWLIREQVPFDWLVYLSGQDYPIRPLRQLEAQLASAGVDGFLGHGEVGVSHGPWRERTRGHRRYFFQYRDAPSWTGGGLSMAQPWINRLQSLVHVSCTYGPKIGLRSRRVPFTNGFRCIAGSQWQALSRPSVEYLHEALSSNSDLVKYYSKTLVPEESLVPTILVNSGRFRFASTPMWHVDFAGSRDGRPRVLTEADRQRLADSPCFLARKFDADVDARILDMLDAQIDAAPSPPAAHS